MFFLEGRVSNPPLCICMHGCTTKFPIWKNFHNARTQKSYVFRFLIEKGTYLYSKGTYLFTICTTVFVSLCAFVVENMHIVER
jgi:hypothetical protein